MREPITIVTRKAKQRQGELILLGDIRVRFPRARAAGTTYEQQRNEQHDIDTHAYRMLGHTEHVFPTFMPTGHIGETSQDDSLRKAFVACQAFRGKDNNNLSPLFQDSLHELYDMLFDIDADVINAPEDIYTAISDAMEASKDNHTIEVDAMHTLYLFEFSSRLAE